MYRWKNDLRETLKLEILRQFFASIVKIEPTIPHNELTTTAFRSIRFAAQAQKNIDNNFIVTGLITEDDWISPLTLRKRLVSHSRILPSKSGDSAKTTNT